MQTVTLQMKNAEGLHARPATEFSNMAAGFKSEIWLEKDGVEADAKSMLMVLSACVCQGESFVLKANGEDERIAIEALAELVNSFE